MFIKSARDGETFGHAHLEEIVIVVIGSFDVTGVDRYQGGFCSGCDGRSSFRGDAMLDIRASDGLGVEWLDVEDDGDDVHVKPETGTNIGGLEGNCK